MGNVHRHDRPPGGLTDTERPSRRLALGVSAGLSLLFIFVYGVANFLAALRSNVPVFAFQWENRIPFVPFFVLPYLSIDLFFVAAPFLCRSQTELTVFTRRVAAAITIAGSCFVLFPLRCSFPPVHASGWIGHIFSGFLTLDRPYNLLPSLHAALGLLLFDLCFRHSRGLVRAFLGVWFCLIGLSPILTHQHQVADIVAGFALAGYCFYFFTSAPGFSVPGQPNLRLGLIYAMSALPLLALAVLNPGRFFLPAWVAVSLLCAATGYLRSGPRVFKKMPDGRLPIGSLFVMGPCIFGQYLSWLYYRRRGNTFTRAASSVWFGPRPNHTEALELQDAGVTAVLDLSAELPASARLRHLRYRCVPILDLAAPGAEELATAANFIAAEAGQGRVYVHCKIGYSRSAAAVAAYFLLTNRAATVVEAVAIIKELRPVVVFSTETLNALEAFRLRVGPPEQEDAFLLASPSACGA